MSISCFQPSLVSPKRIAIDNIESVKLTVPTDEYSSDIAITFGQDLALVQTAPGKESTSDTSLTPEHVHVENQEQNSSVDGIKDNENVPDDNQVLLLMFRRFRLSFLIACTGRKEERILQY